MLDEEKLLPFQREGVTRGIEMGGRILIGDEMGLGKTVQAIALAARYRSEWPLLIFCPTSMALPWAEELEKWCLGKSEILSFALVFTRFFNHWAGLFEAQTVAKMTSQGPS